MMLKSKIYHLQLKDVFMEKTELKLMGKIASDPIVSKNNKEISNVSFEILVEYNHCGYIRLQSYSISLDSLYFEQSVLQSYDELFSVGRNIVVDVITIINHELHQFYPEGDFFTFRVTKFFFM
jgi:hypothetical protein